MQAEAAQWQGREAVVVEREHETAGNGHEDEDEHQYDKTAQQEIDHPMLVHARLR
ncbi:hypothetical protein D3C76_1828810 [compost metagenome]